MANNLKNYELGNDSERINRIIFWLPFDFLTFIIPSYIERETNAKSPQDKQTQTSNPSLHQKTISLMDISQLFWHVHLSRDSYAL